MFLSLKNIPIVSWSSDKPLNFKPKISTFFFLCFGLSLFGLGEGLLIVSLTGASPWTVFAEGISNYIDFSIGTVTFFVSAVVIFLWIFLNQKPGIGTVLNALIIAVMIDVSIAFIPSPENFIYQVLLAIFAVLIVGLGSGLYLVANLGPGPRDGLMTGIQRKTNFPIALVRAFLEISVVSIGWYLGGTVGIGTLLFAFGVGPAVALGLFIVGKIFN
ncbi:hypothetical protein OAJ75_01660 [Candidatus Pelagibacter sp.]|nr:hypothetical protein [Candidatus Pelagibacter sp.]